MWICLNEAFISIVRKREPELARACGFPANTPGLVVRARRRQDLEYLRARYAPGLVIVDRPGHDYPVGTMLRADTVAQMLADAVHDIDYRNFKDSVVDDRLHDAYARVWGVMLAIEDPEVPVGQLAL